MSANRLTEHLDTQHVADDFLRLAIGIGVHKSDVVVRRDDIAQGRKSLLYALEHDRIGQRIPQMLQLLVGRRVGDQQSPSIPGRGPPNKPIAADCSVNHGNMLAQLAFEDAVKVLRTTDALVGRKRGKKPKRECENN